MQAQVQARASAQESVRVLGRVWVLGPESDQVPVLGLGSGRVWVLGPVAEVSDCPAANRTLEGRAEVREYSDKHPHTARRCCLME